MMELREKALNLSLVSKSSHKKTSLSLQVCGFVLQSSAVRTRGGEVAEMFLIVLETWKTRHDSDAQQRGLHYVQTRVLKTDIPKTQKVSYYIYV